MVEQPVQLEPSRFPRRAWVRVALMLLSTLWGWLLGAVAVAVVAHLAFGPKPDTFSDRPLWLRELLVGVWFTGFGCVAVFPTVLLWMAIFVRSQAPICRLSFAPGFGAACGIAAAFLIAVPLLTRAVMLSPVSVAPCLVLGALVGAVVWTSYLLLARYAVSRTSRAACAQ